MYLPILGIPIQRPDTFRYEYHEMVAFPMYEGTLQNRNGPCNTLDFMNVILCHVCEALCRARPSEGRSILTIFSPSSEFVFFNHQKRQPMIEQKTPISRT